MSEIDKNQPVPDQPTSRGLFMERGWLVFDSGIPMTTEESSKLIEDAREARMRFITGESDEP